MHRCTTAPNANRSTRRIHSRLGPFCSFWHTALLLTVLLCCTPDCLAENPIGHALVTNDQTKYARHGWDDLDPTVFVDDDGRAFLYWGNNACYFAELKADMISLKGEISFVPLNKETFGPDFEEAPWLYKRNGLYYLVYASGLPEVIRYATGKSPVGPWAYRGLIMDKPRQRGLGTNHPAIVETPRTTSFGECRTANSTACQQG
jgi:beta-xylosidase